MSDDRARLEDWVLRHRMAFALADGGLIVERHSGKTLALGPIAALEEDRDPIRGGSYLRVFLEDGRHLALTGIGFAFAPSFVNTGPVPDCPPVASFFDYEKIDRHLAHLAGDAHEGHEREALQTLMILIAYLDGARAVGLDVGPEERALEKRLEQLEARGIAP